MALPKKHSGGAIRARSLLCNILHCVLKGGNDISFTMRFDILSSQIQDKLARPRRVLAHGGASSKICLDSSVRKRLSHHDPRIRGSHADKEGAHHQIKLDKRTSGFPGIDNHHRNLCNALQNWALNGHLKAPFGGLRLLAFPPRTLQFLSPHIPCPTPFADSPLPPAAMSDAIAQLSLNGQETEHLESVLQSWTSKSRTEKSAFKEELISKFLKDRGLDTANLWMRFVLRVVRPCTYLHALCVDLPE